METDPTPLPESRRFAIRLPRPLWIGLVTVVLVVTGAALRFGLPIYRQRAAIHEIERMGGGIRTRPRGPVWLRQWIGDERTKWFDEVTSINFVGAHEKPTDTTLGHVKSLGGLQQLYVCNSPVTDAGMAVHRGSARVDLKKKRTSRSCKKLRLNSFLTGEQHVRERIVSWVWDSRLPI